MLRRRRTLVAASTSLLAAPLFAQAPTLEKPKLTLAVGSKLFLYAQRFLWGDFAAAAILSGLPISAVFILAQRWMVSGLTSGGLKG